MVNRIDYTITSSNVLKINVYPNDYFKSLSLNI